MQIAHPTSPHHVIQVQTHRTHRAYRTRVISRGWSLVRPAWGPWTDGDPRDLAVALRVPPPVATDWLKLGEAIATLVVVTLGGAVLWLALVVTP